VPVPKSEFDCTGKPDGHYCRQKCQPQYIVCVAGSPFKGDCPAGTVFDPAVARCDWKSLCGKSWPAENVTSSKVESVCGGLSCSFKKPSLQQLQAPRVKREYGYASRQCPDCPSCPDPYLGYSDGANTFGDWMGILVGVAIEHLLLFMARKLWFA